MIVRSLVALVVSLLAQSSSALQVGKLPQRGTKAAAPKAIAIPLDTAEKLSTVTENKKVSELPPTERWVEELDYDAFTKDVNDLGKQLLKEGSQEDVDHLNKMLAWRDVAAIVGIASMALPPNPLTVLALSTWTFSSWTMVAHHTCHGGYNRVDAGKFNSRGFALGSLQRRLQDWCDWMFPEAWNIEHNRLHHYHLGELKDPDLVQRNVEWLREMKAPVAAKYGVVAFFMLVWKWFYYAPNTFKELQVAAWKREGKELPAEFKVTDAATVLTMVAPKDASQRAANQVIDVPRFFLECLGPYFVTRFVLLPAPLLAVPVVGPVLWGHAMVNMLLAELLTNVHGFLAIVTNHAGNDLYTFDDQVRPKTGSFYVRQIVGSVNFDLGSNLVDFAHGWLNYQIEHHVWPDLSMRQYQTAAPRLKAICEKHGVPYVQENVFARLMKTVDIMVGKTTMREFPTHLEPAADKATKGVSWKSTNGAIDEE
jgi:fatty acid desaturase